MADTWAGKMNIGLRDTSSPNAPLMPYRIFSYDPAIILKDIFLFGRNGTPDADGCSCDQFP